MVKEAGTFPLLILLGAMSKLIPDNTDLNNIKTTGNYYKLSNCGTLSNLPRTMGEVNLEVLINQYTNGAYYGFQRVTASSGDKYVRAIANNSWTSWRKTYDESLLYNSTELSDLASALGGVNALQIKGSQGTTQVVSLPKGNVYKVFGDASVGGDPANFFLASFNYNGVSKFGIGQETYFMSQVNFSMDGNGVISVTIPSTYTINFHQLI